VFLLDDHELLRAGLRQTLLAAGGFDVVGESGSAREASRRIPALKPQVMLLDVQLADGSGIEVCRHVRDQDPSIRALMVTTYDDDTARLAAVVAGASGFVLKQIHGGELVDAVRRIARGQSLVGGPQNADVVAQAAARRASSSLDRLTAQERRVLGLVAEGLTNRQIGQRLGIGEKTVKNHVTRVLLKLGFARRTQAAVFLTRLQSG
jgi:RNA polymerase sigma factor (sigma-70 family)